MSRSLVCYFLFIVTLSAAILYAGPVTQILFGHDIFSLLEGGWKIFNGNLPYLDFHTLMGPMVHLMMAMGIVIVGPKAEAFPVSILISFLPVAVLSWHLASRRLGPLVCFIFCTYLALLWTGAYPLHFAFWQTSYAMLYNRQCYVLLILLMLILVCDRKTEWFWSGFLIGILLFFKIPFFIGSLFILGSIFFYIRPSRKELLWGLAGFLLVTFPIVWYLHGITGLVCMATLVLEAGRTRTPDVIEQSIALVRMEFPVIGGLIVLIVISLMLTRMKKKKIELNLFFKDFFKNRLGIEACAVLGAAFFTEFSSSPLGFQMDIPLLAGYSLILLDRLIKGMPGELGFYKNLSSYMAILACFYVILPLWIRSFQSIAWVVAERAAPWKLAGHTHIDSPAFQNMRIYGTCGTYPLGINEVDKINDGLALIRKHQELNRAVVASIDYADTFSFPLQRKSPPHMPLGIQYGFNFNEKVYPDPHEIFEKCDALMVPKYPDTTDQSFSILNEKYAGYIASNFTAVDQTELWTLYVRK